MFGPFSKTGKLLSCCSSAGVCGALSTSKLLLEFVVSVISINEPDAELDPLLVVLVGESFSLLRLDSYFSSRELRPSTEKDEERSPTEERNDSRFSDLVSVVM